MLQGTSSSLELQSIGSSRQIADISGNLIDPFKYYFIFRYLYKLSTLCVDSFKHRDARPDLLLELCVAHC